MTRLFPALLLLLFLPAAVHADAGQVREATLLTVNDVYRIGGTDAGASGGIPRLRSLRLQLQQTAPDLLLLHAGDLLFPSVLSRRYRGGQMIDLLNRLDGDADAFDGRMFVTFGNHEFDQAKLDDAPMLQRRIRESRFHWLGSNVYFKRDEAGRSLVTADNLARSAVVESGGIRIGLFSLTTAVKHPAYVERFDAPLDLAREWTAELRRRGAEVVVALTHQRASRDLEILQRLGAAGPDLIVGGHEHKRQVQAAGGHRLVIKADADARSAAVLTLRLDQDGVLSIRHRFAELGPDVTPDPDLQQRVAHWQQRYQDEQCAALALDDRCLVQPLGHTRVRLEGEELTIRRFETNLGNWVADQALRAYAGQGAQIAFINAGGLRLNQDLPAGTRITRDHLLQLFAYPSPLGLIRIDGRTLQQIIQRSVHDWSGNGWWLQIAGFAFRHDPDNEGAYDLTLLTPDGPRPVDPDESILAVTNGFLLDPAGGQDGYRMLTPDRIVTPADRGPDLKDLVTQALQRAEPDGIAPRREGRVCNPLRPGPCLALEP